MKFRRGSGALTMQIVVVGFCVVWAVGGAGAARAADWSGLQLGGAAEKVALFGISCPTASLCVAVGANNTVASSTDPSGGAVAWNVVNPGAGSIPIGSNFRQIRSISCPSAQLCVSVSFEGLIYTTTDPTGEAAAWQVTDLDPEGPNIHLYGVYCPTASFCAASAGGAKVLTSTDPTGGAAAWSTTQLEGSMELRGISCASSAFCVAVGDNGDNTRPEPTDQALALSSTNPLAGAWEKVTFPGRQHLFGVSCPSAQLCVSGDELGNLLVATDPSSGAWHQIDGGGSVQITDSACPSPTLCLAVDDNGDALSSTNPTGGAEDWTFTNIAPFPQGEETAANAFFAVSCPGRSFCAIAANKGQIFTSQNPFAVTTTEVAPIRKHRKHRKRPKRPHVTIAARPAPINPLARGKLKARFRFFARNHVQVRGFACKLDGRPLRRCRSPKTYHVGYGHHVFRVRAIGWTGLKGPAEVDRFRVCHPTRYPDCEKHLPPPTGT